VISQTFADPARTTPDGLKALCMAVADLAFEADPTVIMQVGFAANVVDRLGPARAAFLRVAQGGRDSGAAGLVIQAQVLLAFDSYWTGRWDDAGQRADEVIALCERHGFPLFAASARHVHAAVAAARGEAGALESTLRALISWGTPRGAGLAAQMAAHVRSVDALGRGDFEAAYRWSSSISQAGELASHAQFALWVFMDLVESCVRTGRHAEARAHVAMLRRAGVANLSPRLCMLTRAACAMVAMTTTHRGSSTRRCRPTMSISGPSIWPGSGSRTANDYAGSADPDRPANSSSRRRTASNSSGRRPGWRGPTPNSAPPAAVLRWAPATHCRA
jgi:hypothetical protein